MDRLIYSIHAVSSEDVDAPAVGLTDTGSQVRGWHCSKKCTYPQELFLRLDRVSKLQQIQLLSHEYKIPTKVELFVGVFPPGTTCRGVGQMTWKRLGSMPFDSNERSGFQARELKSVHINTEAQYLRIVLHKPHPNQYNLHNQVGLVAINLHGSVEEDSVEPALFAGLPGGPALAEYPNLAGNLTSTSSRSRSEDQSDVDSLTARRIAELKGKKDAAVAEENYDEAKALKLEIDRLKSIGCRILELEKRCMQTELCLRHIVQSLKFYLWKQLAIQEEDYDTAKAIKGEIARVRVGGSPSAVDEVAIRVDASAPPQPSGVSISISDMPAVARKSRQSWEGTGAHPEAASDWEQPAARRDSSALEQEAAELSLSGRADPDSGLGAPPLDWPTGLPPPEALSPADTKDADDVSELLGPYVAAAMYSKSWQLREAALQQLQKFLSQQDPEKQRAALPAATRAVQRAVKERVPRVLQAGLQVLTELVEAGAKAMGREAASLTSDVLPTLLEKIGDSNSRIQSTASDAIIRMAKVKESGLSSLATTFVRQQRQTAWRPVLARLQLLTKLVPFWGVASTGGEGLPLEGLMKFVGAAFGNPNADVRSAAVALTVLVHKTAGGAVVEKLLPRDLNPKIREQIEAATKPPGSPPVPAVAARRASSEGSKPASERRQSGGSQKANEKPPPAVSSASPSVNHAEEEAGVLTEDPTPYQLELISREQILGANHPEVAVSLSNLAILHNQRGEYPQAQPLYERALAIFEMNFGPFNANVAHTLTDLAVLHLEQGNVEAGRPLLERALAIQEKALGPDHPDVVAIRDVLDDREE